MFYENKELSFHRVSKSNKKAAKANKKVNKLLDKLTKTLHQTNKGNTCHAKLSHLDTFMRQQK